MTTMERSPQPKHVRGVAERAVWRTELSPLSFLRRAEQVFADSPALVHGERRYSYRELGERVNRLASTLRSLGVDRHDRVAVLAPNTPAMVEAHFGVPAAGGILVGINTRLGPAEVAGVLSHAEPRVLLVDAEYEPLLAAAGHSISWGSPAN